MSVEIKERRYVNIFFLDGPPREAKNIMLLRRASDEADYPDIYSGVGGRVEEDDEDVLEAGLRELQEEVPSYFGVTESGLIWIGTVIINPDKEDRKKINYFFLPIVGLVDPPECLVGKLEWMPIQVAIENQKFFPDAREMLEIWSGVVNLWPDFRILLTIERESGGALSEDYSMVAHAWVPETKKT